ncbi:MBL fold metallo-hydrolase [Streptacidiphilus sp. P02-A3a]|uniref:MBL fold metallo-hydrolase n=1 Tax=Streptacidiphilus sp. P02-A3a TaxID=2704468 RepID=UPI0015F832A0|nr:MBL fold metallo-hydrolase [Streptacidiphilus sp. P02-A3a]QMU73439.1 MBL fold metallo-hydrolase [Streptacidiphilus sp. P02-A3a]
MSSNSDAPAIDFVSGAPVSGNLDVRWNHGVRRRSGATEPRIQVHAYDEHTRILRQSKTTSYEAPFLYLLFGSDRAILFDTGATADPEAFPLRETVDRLIGEWLDRHPRADYELVVAHTHGHGDHVAGDPQFADRPATRIVGREPEAVQAFFGFQQWPTGTVGFDLGGRVLELIAATGHHTSAVAVHDPWTGILLTGDTVIPGRLYAFDFDAFTDTLDRLVDFSSARPVTHVLGCHIEMTTEPGRDYPLGATYQPNEHALAMTTAQLVEVRDAAREIGSRKGVFVHDDFIIHSDMRIRGQLRMIGRGFAHRLGQRLRRR